MSARNAFPHVLYKYWHANSDELCAAIANGEFEGVTMSSLLKAYLDFQLEISEEHDDEESPPSLKHMVLGKIIGELKVTDDLTAVTRDIAQSLENLIYLQLLSDPRLPYRILRAFLRIPSSEIPDCGAKPDHEFVDVDKTVLANAEYVRRSYTRVKDEDYLVTLEELRNILALPKESEYQSFPKKYPRTSRFGKSDLRANNGVGLLTHETDFVEVFNNLTSGFLCGLDWTNVIVAGELVLASLTGEEIRGKSIRLYIYGLDANSANEKVDHIHDVWVANLPYDQNKLVTKTAKQICLFGSRPTHPIQIDVKLYHNITDILLACQYQYAIGYDGTQILMLPSCARAIETGYFSDHKRFKAKKFKKYASSMPTRQLDQEPLMENELPTFYDWERPGSSFTELVEAIDGHSRYLFARLQDAICELLQIIPVQRFGYSNYLTRRIRRQVDGSDLKTVFQKQITLPLMMPFDLEGYIRECLNQGADTASNSLHSQIPFINVHDPTKHDHATAQLPSLIPTSNEQGNLKYWVLSNESMWTGQDKRQDAVSKILWCLVAWFVRVTDGGDVSYRTDSAECLVWTIDYLRKKMAVLPGIPLSTTMSGEDKAYHHWKNQCASEPLLMNPWSMDQVQ